MCKSPSEGAKRGMHIYLVYLKHIYLVGSPGERLEMDVMGPFSDTERCR